MDVLEVEDLHKSFVLHTIDGRTVSALCGVTLTVRAGEHVALAGSSGAGKSSLLKCIYRTYRPTSGIVRLSGAVSAVTTTGGPTDPAGTWRSVELTTLPDAELARVRGRELGYVSQFLRAEPRRGPLDIVSRAGTRRGMDAGAAREAAAAALKRLNIDEGLWDVHASVLSGGEKQRVNLAAGTISPPRLLLLDEPVSALDPANREAALDMIAELTTRGVAVLSVFHDLDAMHRLATRVVVMREGRITGDGAPAEVLATVAGVAR